MASPRLLEDRQAWLAERTTYLGGTDVAVLVGKNPYKTAVGLYLEKTGTPDEPAGRKAEAGTALEPCMRRWFTEDTGIPILEIGLVRDAEHPFLAANTDGLIDLDGEMLIGGKSLTGNGIWECKTYDFGTRDNWGEAWTDEVPVHYWVQAQWYTGILGRQWAILSALDRGTMDWTPFLIQHDPETYGMMRQLAVKYWNDHIVTGTAPELTEHDASNILRLYPQPEAELIDSTPEIEEVAERMAAIYPTRKALNNEWDSLSNRMKVAIAGGTRVNTDWGIFENRRGARLGKPTLSLASPFKDSK